jgi:hypothetical protein
MVVAALFMPSSNSPSSVPSKAEVAAPFQQWKSSTAG